MITKVLLIIIKLINYVIPKNKKKIIFYSAFDFNDNSRAIYEYIKKSKTNEYKCVWLVNDINKYKKLNEPCKFYKHKSILGLINFLTSKYIIRTHSLFGNNYNVKKQILICAFHGMPFKYLTKEETKIKRFNPCDAVLSTSIVFNDVLSDMLFVQKEKIFVTGLPRNDMLFENKIIKTEMGFSSYKKILIWMPTFRKTKVDSFNDGIYSEIGLPCIRKENLDELNKKLNSKNFLLILKLHPWACDSIIDFSIYSNIINIKNEDIPLKYTLYNLIGVCDLLITDYSSVYIDFLLVDKPVVFVFDDFEEYERKRGFALNPPEKYMPGEKIKSFDEFINFIEEFSLGHDKYIYEREKIKKELNEYCDNKSSERAFKLIEKIAQKK